MKTLGKTGGRQPETTGDNLKTEVVSLFSADNQGLTSTGDTGDNLFGSHTYARREKAASGVFLLYRRSWQKVVSTVSRPYNPLMLCAIRGDNLKNEVVSGCLPAGAGRAA